MRANHTRSALISVIPLVAGCLAPWAGKVEVTPVSRAAIEACGNGALTAEGKQVLLRWPYVQNVTQTEAVIAWGALPRPGYSVELLTPKGESVGVFEARGDRRTTGVVPMPARVASRGRAAIADVSDTRRTGPNCGDDFDDDLDQDEDDDADEEAEERRERRQGAACEESSSRSQTIVARLKGLQPGTLYCYRVNGPRGAMTAPAPFQTAPAAGAGATVQAIVLGDSGDGSAAQRAIARRLSEQAFELMLFVGDIAYTHGTRRQLQTRFFDVYRDYMQHTPVFPSLGNHDVRTRNGRAYLDSFVLPDEERWYSFDWGDAHFVALDTTRIGPQQAAWLDRDLARNDRKWVIVYGHHPPSSSGWRGGSARFQLYFMPVLRRHRVDLILTGHEHHYERITMGGGMHLVICGGGGARLRSTRWGARPAKLRVIHHFVKLEIKDDELDLRAISIEGKEIDHLELKK